MDTHLQLCVDSLGQLLSVRLEEFSGGLERFEVLLVADLSVPYGHQVSHDVHEARIVAIYDLVRETAGCVLDKRGKLSHTAGQGEGGRCDVSGWR